jgi:hypothetical protein
MDATGFEPAPGFLMLRWGPFEERPSKGDRWEMTTADGSRIPDWARWCAVAWLAVWVPSYWWFWGFSNFIHLCDLAIFLGCLGLWTNSALLLSSQAVSSLLIDSVWTLDALWRLVTGHHLIGGTEYLFDPKYPIWLRVLSLFHLLLPVALIFALRRTGYDRWGWLLQCGIAAVVVPLSRLAGSANNYNFAFRDPVWHRALGPAPIHLAAIFAALVVMYWITDVALGRFLPAARGLDRIAEVRDL